MSHLKETFLPGDLYKMVLEDTLKPSATFYATQKSRKYQILDICVNYKKMLFNPSEVFRF